MHPEIDNPEYSADQNIYKFDNIGVLGLDLWQVWERDDHFKGNVILLVIHKHNNLC